MVIAEALEYRRYGQLIERRNLAGDAAENSTDAGHLAEDIDTKPAAFIGYIREVEIVAGLEAFSLAKPSSSEIDWQKKSRPSQKIGRIAHIALLWSSG